ncbi:MAG TPA: ThuA domain-containing protein [Actinomycetes bacterium]|jgi:trehalose utilization protein|nr:ThuA domain-containing protein [Actinomycetes bacterium]
MPEQPAAAVRVTVWNEHLSERREPAAARAYPRGLHVEVAGAIRELLGDAAAVRTATLDQPGQGLPAALLDATDVLVWWGHLAHERVTDRTVARVRARVLAGMGLVALHSAHLSKVFVSLMGTSCNLSWREGEDRELLWTVSPSHPIARGVPHPLQLGPHEMYGEFFDIPPPDELVFVSSFSGGEVFRSGCCFQRGAGRIFYFSPGHETQPVYRLPGVRRVLANAVAWAHNPAPPAIVPAASERRPAGWFGAQPPPATDG